MSELSQFFKENPQAYTVIVMVCFFAACAILICTLMAIGAIWSSIVRLPGFLRAQTQLLEARIALSADQQALAKEQKRYYELEASRLCEEADERHKQAMERLRATQRER